MSANDPRYIKKTAILEAAASLVASDETEANPEYDRAISELTCDLLGVSSDHKDAVLDVLRALDI